MVLLKQVYFDADRSSLSYEQDRFIKHLYHLSPLCRVSLMLPGLSTDIHGFQMMADFGDLLDKLLACLQPL